MFRQFTEQGFLAWMAVILSIAGSQLINNSIDDDVISTTHCKGVLPMMKLMREIKDELKSLRQEVHGPPIQTNCSVFLASSGYNDTVGDFQGYIRTNVDTKGYRFTSWKDRGFNTAILDPYTCSLYDWRNFDTYSNASHSHQLATYLQSLPPRTILAGVTHDSAENQLAPAYSTLRAMGLPDVGKEYGYPGFRTKLIFIIQRAYPRKTAVFRQKRLSPTLAVEVQLEGSNVIDVLFKQQ